MDPSTGYPPPHRGNCIRSGMIPPDSSVRSAPLGLWFSVLFALLCAAGLAVLCWSLPILPASVGTTGRASPEWLLFVGRFHPVLLHLPVGLLFFAGVLRLLSIHRLGHALLPALTLCLWAGASTVVLATIAGWLLAQEGSYSGPIFDLHWRLGLTTTGLALLLLVLHHARFPGSAVFQCAVWVLMFASLSFGAHQGGSLSHGENFLAEHAPAWIRPLLGGTKAVTRLTPITNETGSEPTFVAASGIFQQYCIDCHGPNKAKGGQRLHTPEGIAKGGNSGESVVPGNPIKSRLVQRMLLSAGDEDHMPPKGKPQPSSNDIEAVRRWIADGAPGISIQAVVVANSQNNLSVPTQSPTPPPRLPVQLSPQSSAIAGSCRTDAPVSDPSNNPPMKPTPALVAAALLTGSTGAAPAQTASAPANNALASDVLKIFQARCAECHGKATPKPAEFGFIDDLTQLRASKYINLKNPQASELYSLVQSGDMPRKTQADKEAGKKQAEPLSSEQVALVLSWINAGAPDGIGGTSASVIAGNSQAQQQSGVAAKPSPSPSAAGQAATIPPSTSATNLATAAAARTPLASELPEGVSLSKIPRSLISPQDEIAAAFADLQSAPREDQADIRYVSLTAAHNNVRINFDQLENLRRGVRKLLNSLSTGSRVATFPEVGPGETLFRVRLRDIGWDAALWDRVASLFPQFLDTGVSTSLGSACHSTVPIIRADWLASALVASPPLYHEILRLPARQQELEKNLSIDLVANLQAGEAVRSGLIKSGISRANRLVERHEIGNREGYFWTSYDFKSSSGRGNLTQNPLGPERARLAGGRHAFQHAGGETFFSLPNGFHAYYLADALGNRLEGAAPTDIVGDRSGLTGKRVEITNGVSCIACHDQGVKRIDSADAILGVATNFDADEQRLIERLHPPGEKFQAILKADTDRFVAALKAANAETVSGQPEPVAALVLLFDSEVSLQTAAAEIGLSPSDLEKKLKEQSALFALRVGLDGGGTIQREQFLDDDAFPALVQRLGIGTVRKAKALATVPLPGRTERPRPIAIELKTDKTTYHEGDDLVVTVQAAESGHLRLLYQNAAGEVYTLFPNQFITDDLIEGGRPVKVMPVANPKKAGDEVAIQIQGPNFGTEYLAAIVTDQPFTDEAVLREEFKKAPFSKSAARDIERVITKDARVVSRPAREGAPGGARAGFARMTLTTIKK